MEDKDYHDLLQRYSQTGTSELEQIVLPNSGFREKAIMAAHEVLFLRRSGAPDPDEVRRRAAMEEMRKSAPKAPTTVLKILLSFRGRISLSTFWKYQLLLLVVMFIAMSGGSFFSRSGATEFSNQVQVQYSENSKSKIYEARHELNKMQQVGNFILLFVGLPIFLMTLSLWVKRLHDVDMSGFRVLFMWAIPLNLLFGFSPFPALYRKGENLLNIYGYAPLPK